MEIITGCFKEMSNNRLIKGGIINSNFSVIEDVNEDCFRGLKVGDIIKFSQNGLEIKAEVVYKYRDKKDIKIKKINS